MTKSDWINVVVAIGVIATAMFTAITALAARRQTRILLPVVRCSALRKSDHVALYAELPVDNERHFIARITLLRPWRAHLIRPDWRQNSTGQPLPIASRERRRSLLFDGSPVNPPIALVDAEGASSIKVRFHVALRADSSVVNRFTTRIKIRD